MVPNNLIAENQKSYKLIEPLKDIVQQTRAVYDQTNPSLEEVKESNSSTAAGGATRSEPVAGAKHKIP